LLELMYACGLRATEAIELEVSDVDLDAGLLRARGKGAKERLVPVGRSAVHALRMWLGRGRAPRAAPVRHPPRRRPDPPGPVQDRPAPRVVGGPGREDESAHTAPHVRDPPA